MWKQLLILTLVLAGLVAWERSLTERTAQSRQAGVRIERLFDPEEVFTPEQRIAAVRVDGGDGSLHLYVHEQGVWRCVTAFGAIARSESIFELLTMIAGETFPEAVEPPRGVLRTSDPAAAREFGFDIESMLTLSIAGPDVMTDPTGDVIYALDIGHSIPATGGTYVRPLGSENIWAIEVDLRSKLAGDPDSPVPPLLDPHIVPASWPGFRPPGVDRIVVEVPGEPPLELQRYERELTEEQQAAGAPEWEWSVKRGEGEYVGEAFQVFSYGGFLMQAPYAGILAPRPPEEFGFDRPRGRITLRSAHGLHMQLIIGQRAPRGGVPVLNTFSQNIFELEPGIAELLLPEMDMLLTDHLGNPWEQFLRRRDERRGPG